MILPPTLELKLIKTKLNVLVDHVVSVIELKTNQKEGWSRCKNVSMCSGSVRLFINVYITQFLNSRALP